VPWDVSVHGYRCCAGGGGGGGGCGLLACCGCGGRRGRGCCCSGGGGGLSALLCCGSSRRGRSGSGGVSGGFDPLGADPHLAASGGGGCCGGGRRRGGASLASVPPPSSLLCCCSDVCSADATGTGVAAVPGPLLVAMYRELLEDASFRRPLAWSRSGVTDALRLLPRRTRARYIGRPTRRRTSRRRRAALAAAAGAAQQQGSGSDGSGSDTGSGGSVTGTGSSGSDVDGSTDPSELLLVPDAYDGLVLPGAYPPYSGAGYVHTVAGDGAGGCCRGSGGCDAYGAAAAHVWDDPDLQAVATSFWGSGRPVAAFGNAGLLLARAPDFRAGGRPVLAGVAGAVTALTAAAEVGAALLMAALQCGWGPLVALVSAAGCCGGGGGCGTRGRRGRRRQHVRMATKGYGGGDGVEEVVAGDDAPPPVTVQAEVQAALAAGGGGAGVDPYDADGAPSPTAYRKAFAGGGGAAAFVAGESPLSMRAALRTLLHGEPPLVRPPPTPFDESRVVVAEAGGGRLLTAQGGHDAYVVTRRYIDRLEEVQRTF
jgi:hypothetical protein